jgi:hypothetical protein
MRVNKQETTEKWYSLLFFLENELKINKHKNISILLSKYKVCHRWGTFLIKKNIIYLENGYYRWNEKIPVSNKLINLYRKYQTEENKRNIKYKKQEPNLFNMPQSPLPKPPKIRKTRTPKVEVQVKDKPKSELGLIRSFFKWLW